MFSDDNSKECLRVIMENCDQFIYCDLPTDEIKDRPEKIYLLKVKYIEQPDDKPECKEFDGIGAPSYVHHQKVE